MKKTSLITFILLINTLLFAQDNTAESILNRLETEYKKCKNMNINFDFIYKNQTHEITKQGEIYIESNGFILDIDNQIITNNGKYHWIYLKESNELQIMLNEMEDNIINPKNIFQLNKDQYKYKYEGTEKNGEIDVIHLFPKESTIFSRLELRTHQKTNNIHNITILDKNGGIYIYVIKSTQTNIKSQPTEFDTSKYENIEIIDLR
tara:strand:+ start:57 stop:674 length:618 start_codon:yes stop_codon:yes gene_type:complete